MNPVIQKTALHFGRLALFAAGSAVLTYGVLPAVAALAHAHFPAALQPYIALFLPTIAETIKRYADTLQALLQQEANSQEVSKLKAELASATAAGQASK